MNRLFENKNYSLFQKISHFGIYIFAFSIPISFVPAQFGVVIALIGWLLEGIKNKHWQYAKSYIYIPIILYLLWNLLASLLSARPLHSLFAIFDNEWPMLIMLLMLSTIEDIRILKNTVHLWLFTATIASIYGIWQSFSGYQLHRPEMLAPMGEYFRAVGFNNFYLTFAGFMMTVFFVGLCLSFQNRIKESWKYFVPTIFTFIAIIGTFARSIWIACTVVIPIFAFIRGGRIGKIIFLLFIIIIVCLIMFVPSIKDRAVSSIMLSENETRVNLWKTSLNMIRDNPIIGIGEDNFTYYFNQYKVEGFYDTDGHPHNDYLNVLVSSGIPGFIFFLSIWLMIIRNGFNVFMKSSNTFIKEIALGATLAIIGFMIGAFFQNYYGTFANCWGWWFMAGLSMTSYKIKDKEKI